MLEPDSVDASGPDSTAAALRPGLDWLVGNASSGWAASLLSALALALLASWSLRLGRSVEDRGRRLARIGGAAGSVALLLGALANVAIGAVRLALTQPGIDRSAAADASAAIVNGNTLAVLFLPGLLLAPVAGVVLLIGLGRSSLLPWWAAVPAGLLVGGIGIAPFGRATSAIVIAVLAAPAAVVLIRGWRSRPAQIAQLDPLAA